MSGTVRLRNGCAPMRRVWILLLLAGCSKGPEADLQYIGQARSLAAEWAMINDQAGRGQLTDVYVRSMHKWLRQQVETTQSSLTQPHSDYAREIAALAAEPDDAAPATLRSHSDRLEQIEDSLESA
jgi:hypothetical protein